MNKIRALLVDDEELARRGLTLRLENYPDIEVCGEARNGREALTAIKKLTPDVLFLDIRMPGLDGFEVVRTLSGDNIPIVIFVTAYDQFALKAFEANALDYLLKPINSDRLSEAIERVRVSLIEKTAPSHRDKLLQLVCQLSGEELTLEEALSESRPHYATRLTLRENNAMVYVEIKDIDWVDAAGDYMCINANGKTFVLRGTMKNLEDQLDPSRFTRIHRSSIVNWQRVVQVTHQQNGDSVVKLRCGHETKMSRSYKKQLGDKLAGH